MFPLPSAQVRFFLGNPLSRPNIGNDKLGKMGSENGTRLRYVKGALGPLRKLAKSLQGEKGVDAH